MILHLRTPNQLLSGILVARLLNLSKLVNLESLVVRLNSNLGLLNLKVDLRNLVVLKGTIISKIEVHLKREVDRGFPLILVIKLILILRGRGQKLTSKSKYLKNKKVLLKLLFLRMFRVRIPRMCMWIVLQVKNKLKQIRNNNLSNLIIIINLRIKDLMNLASSKIKDT